MPYNPNDAGRSYYSGGGLTGGAFGHVGGVAMPMGGLGGHQSFAFRAPANPALITDMRQKFNVMGYSFLDLTKMTSQIVTPARKASAAVKSATSTVHCGVGG